MHIYSEPEKIAQALLARVLNYDGADGDWAHFKAFALQMGVEWGSLDPAGWEKMVSAAMNYLGHLDAEAHAKDLALTRGVEWKSLDHVGRAEMASAPWASSGFWVQRPKPRLWRSMTEDRWARKKPPNMKGFKHSQQLLLKKVVDKCSMITTKLRLSKIVTPFLVFEEHWDPPTRWLRWQMIKQEHSTSSYSNCCVPRVCVTKPTSQEHSRLRTAVRPKASQRDAEPFEENAESRHY